MSYRDIAGAERFEDLGGKLAELVPPDGWAKADKDLRRVLTKRIGAFMRMFSGLDAGDLEIEDLPAGTFGEYDPLTDLVTVGETLLARDDPSDVLATVAHETRHAFQTAILEGVMDYPQEEEASGEVALWREADENYDADDLVAYMYSPLETDARAAEAGVLVGYWRRSYEVLSENR